MNRETVADRFNVSTVYKGSRSSNTIHREDNCYRLQKSVNEKPAECYPVGHANRCSNCWPDLEDANPAGNGRGEA